MSSLEKRGKNLAWDFLVFTEIFFYWPFAIVVMKPAQWLDQRLGTRLFPLLDQIMRSIADK